MINLNSDTFKEKEYSAIFNGANAGRAKNTTIAVTKKTAVDPDNLPDYKLIVTDENGGSVNEGFYYTEENDTKKSDLLISRILHIARAVLGKDYEFPNYGSYKEAVDGMFKLINKNAEGKTFSVFVTYGNVGYPSKYLKLRYFDFIESSDVEDNATRLFAKKNDLLFKVVEDAINPEPTVAGSTSSDDDDWI